MEIRDFCQQLLFSTRLEDKLVRPISLEDDRPGASLGEVTAPGRPPGMAMAARDHQVGFPALHELDDVEAHGRAMHFFANHELLALELMALVLMRFPKAPARFRRALAGIITEEQTHFELYRDHHRVQRIFRLTADQVARALEPSQYVGPVGIDALVYRDRDGRPRLKPVVEIHARSTMGQVCGALRRRVSPAQLGFWAQISLRELEEAGFSATSLADYYREAFPVVRSAGVLVSGALMTTEPSRARSFVTALLVARTTKELMQMIPIPSFSAALGQMGTD